MESLHQDPYEDPEERGRAELYDLGIEACPDIPELADRWLAEWAADGGLPTTGRGISMGGRELVSPVAENPANTSSDPMISHAMLANGQTLWVRRAKRRLLNGYRGVGVFEKPDRTTKAVLAALTIQEGRGVPPERLARVLPFVDPVDQASIGDSLFRRFEELKERGDKAAADVLVLDRPLQYAQALLRYYRPVFDSLPKEEQRELIGDCCERVNALLDSTRHLVEFLEYGFPGRDQRPAVENPSRDVEAAVLREVEGLKHREIAERLGVEISEKSAVVGDYSTVAKMVQRGRDILERAYGHDRWDELAESMRQELSDWKELSAEEQMKELSPNARLRTSESPPDLEFS
jgi:hypothetical protein